MESNIRKIIVIGDLMLDIYHYCETTRNAAEANIPLYKITDTKYVLGGASNVANNLNILFNNRIFSDPPIEIIFISIIGEDESGKIIKELLKKKNITSKLIIDSSRPTTQKIRLINNNSFVGRYDIEYLKDISEKNHDEIMTYILNIKNIDSIIISDYAKGIITNKLCKEIIDYSNKNNIYTFIDPKPFHYEKYSNCFCFKPNLNEGIQISGVTDIPKILEKIKETINSKHIILTCDRNGMYLDNIHNHIQNNNDKIKVLDVTGCGDVALSVIVYIYNIYKDLLKACKIANYITTNKAITCIGNYQINMEDIKEALDWENSFIKNFSKKFIPKLKNKKLINDYEVDKITKISKLDNLVFTNGCFDIIHSAHIKILKYAKSLGKVLVLGLNSDSSIKQLKGIDRPINKQEERIEFLSELDWIDYIIIFNDTTPYNILKILKPDIMVKGGDYTIDKIIGSEFAKKIIIFDYIENYSTTNIIKKIKT